MGGIISTDGYEIADAEAKRDMVMAQIEVYCGWIGGPHRLPCLVNLTDDVVNVYGHWERVRKLCLEKGSRNGSGRLSQLFLSQPLGLLHPKRTN